jgi:hypothetical protein
VKNKYIRKINKEIIYMGGFGPTAIIASLLPREGSGMSVKQRINYVREGLGLVTK